MSSLPYTDFNAYIPMLHTLALCVLIGGFVIYKLFSIPRQIRLVWKIHKWSIAAPLIILGVLIVLIIVYGPKVYNFLKQRRHNRASKQFHLMQAVCRSVTPSLPYAPIPVCLYPHSQSQPPAIAMNTEQRIRKFLQDYPDGTLRVATEHTSLWGIAWLHRHTPRRRVELLVAYPQGRLFWRAHPKDYQAALDFLGRDNVEVRNWRKADDSRADIYKNGWLVINGVEHHLMIGDANLSKRSFGQSQGQRNNLGFGHEQDFNEGQGKGRRQGQRRENSPKLLKKLEGTELDDAVAYMDDAYAFADDCKETLAREIREEQLVLLKQSPPHLGLETGADVESESGPTATEQSARRPVRQITKPRQQTFQEPPTLF